MVTSSEQDGQFSKTSVADMNAMKATLDEMRDNLANFDDRSVRSATTSTGSSTATTSWRATASKSLSDASDGVDVATTWPPTENDVGAMIGGMDDMVGAWTAWSAGMGEMNSLFPQMIAQFPPIIATATDHHAGHPADHPPSSFNGLIRQMQQMTDTATAMGEAFDASRATTTSTCRRRCFSGLKGLTLFLSPDGKGPADRHPTRIQLRRGGISIVDDELVAAHKAVRGVAGQTPTSTSPARPPTATSRQAQVRHHDRRVRSATLIFIVMLIITRAWLPRW